MSCTFIGLNSPSPYNVIGYVVFDNFVKNCIFSISYIQRAQTTSKYYKMYVALLNKKSSVWINKHPILTLIYARHFRRCMPVGDFHNLITSGNGSVIYMWYRASFTQQLSLCWEGHCSSELAMSMNWMAI